MDGLIRAGDVIITLMDANTEAYAIGTAVEKDIVRPDGNLGKRHLTTAIGRDNAIRRACKERTGDEDIWMFEGPPGGSRYSKITCPKI